MILSPLTPIFFKKRKGRDGTDSAYIQIFAPSDQIMVQMIGLKTEEKPDMKVYNAIDDSLVYGIVFNEWEINSTTILYYHIITGLSEGCYYVTINEQKSEFFRITNNTYELQQTTLLQYSMKDNRERLDAVFFINGIQYFFDFRVPGGFRDNGWSFAVSNEQYGNDKGEIVELYSCPQTRHILIVGNAIDCPIWFAEILNNLLCCTYVYVDGERYARSESSVPELSQIEGYNSFVITQLLQKASTYDIDKHQLLLRRVDDSYRATEGETLLYINYD